MNNIEMRKTTFKKPVGVHIMCGGEIVRTLNNVRFITEKFDIERGRIRFAHRWVSLYILEYSKNSRRKRDQFKRIGMGTF